jgi:hypothetical protein
MPAATYPKKTLARKLGIKAGMEVLIFNAPRGYFALLGKLPRGCKLLKTSATPVPFLHLFAQTRKELQSSLPGLKRRMLKEGTLWISWPKKSSGVDTDLSDRAVRDIGLEAGLVDVKVASIDEVWSGLKFVYRLKDR